jgi:histidinol-phosphate aminotransferase
MKSIWDLANPQLRDLTVYEPGKPIEETARELGVAPTEIVKLASNENPLGPSPVALEAMRHALESVHLYPDGGSFYLREALATHLEVDPGQLILGNGSNELIEFICHAFLRAGDEVVTPRYAFIAYKIIATLFAARTIEADAPDFRQDLNAILAAITRKTRLIFVANPNNPTGNLVRQDEIERFMAQVPSDVVVVFDEAYYEFNEEPPDLLRHVREGRNLILLRTFSKIHGLAGLRVGYAIAPPELVQVLEKAREPFNVNSLAQVAARAALGDVPHQRRTRQLVAEGRAFFETEFARLGLRFLPSPANFMMVQVGDGASVFRKLLQEKVIVRPLRGYGLAEWVRISVGTMPENRKCIGALEKVLTKTR